MCNMQSWMQNKQQNVSLVDVRVVVMTIITTLRIHAIVGCILVCALEVISCHVSSTTNLFNIEHTLFILIMLLFFLKKYVTF